MADVPLTGRAVSAFRWSALAAVAELLLALAILATLSRLLAPGDFGLVAIAMVFVALIGAVGRLGIGPAIVQRLELTRRHLATGFALSAGLGAAMSAGLWTMAPLTAPFFDDPQAPAVLAALCAVFTLAGLAEVSEHLLHRRLRFRQLMAAGVLAQTAGYGLVAIAMALAGHGVWSLVAGLLARQAVFAAAVLAFAPPPLGARPGRREALDLLRFGAGFSATALLGAVAVQGGRFVIGSALGAAALGHYVQATRVAGAPHRLGRVLQRVLFPAMAERQHRPDRLRAAWLHGIEAMSLLAASAAVFLALCAPEIVAVLFGAQWGAAVPVLQVLAAGIAFHVCDIVNISAIRALGAVYPEAWRTAAFAVLAVLGILLGAHWGVAGAAAGFVGARILLYLLLTQLALRLLGLGWTPLMRCHAPALWTAAWSGAAAWLAAELARGAGLPDAATLAAAFAAAGAAAAAAVRLATAAVRPRSLAWALAHLPFAELGMAGPPLRFVLHRLAPGSPGQSSGANPR